MTHLLRPELTCPECGLPLDQTGARYGDGPAGKDQDAWRPNIEAQTLSCRAGHEFDAIYEQRERWRRVLVGIGPPSAGWSTTPPAI